MIVVASSNSPTLITEDSGKWQSWVHSPAVNDVMFRATRGGKL